MPLLHVGAGGPSWLDWIVHLDALILVIVLGWAYTYAITELRPRVSDAGRVRRGQVALFAAGLLAIYLAGGTAIHDLGEEYFLTAHVVQHLLFAFVAPPLLIAGVPGWLWMWLLDRPIVMPVARALTKPFVAFATFNALLVLLHMPSVLNLTLEVGAVHFSAHAVLVIASLIVWWPILSPLPELPRLSYPAQMGYLFLQSLLPAVIASFVTFADGVVYSFYRDAPRLWSVEALEDQQIAGGIWKLSGSLILWGFMTWAFFKWYGQERAEEAEPRWPDVEDELEELGLAQR